LRIVQRELNSDALSIITTGAHTQWGHLALTMAPAVYLALTNGLAFMPPAHPGDDPIFAPNSRSVSITDPSFPHLLKPFVEPIASVQTVK
jgi:hypothetical protein